MQFSRGISYSALCFAQMTFRQSMRDIEARLRRAQRVLAYHLGFRGTITHSARPPQRTARLAGVGAFRAEDDSEDPRAVSGGVGGAGYGRGRDSGGLQPHRPEPDALSVGQLHLVQGRAQTARRARSPRSVAGFH